MKTAVFALLAAASLAAVAQTYVRPHVTKNGTYVEGHYRSSPNGTQMDNYGTKGNTNPFTGQPGTVTPGYNSAPTYTQPAPIQVAPQPLYGQTCGYNHSGQYVCQ